MPPPPPRNHFPVNGISQLLDPNVPMFPAGDWNCSNRRWNCSSTTHRGAALHRVITHYQASLHYPDSPTHIDTRVGHANSTIDFAISKLLPYQIRTFTINDLSSDHLPVAFKIDLIKPISAPLTKPLTGKNMRSVYVKTPWFSLKLIIPMT